MAGTAPVAPPPPAPRRRWIWAGAALIVLAGAAAYSDTLAGPFVFDDKYTIIEHPDIGRLWPPWVPLAGPKDSPSAGRPLVSLSLALNYAAGGRDVTGYHVVNLVIHLLAGLALYGLVRRTLLLESLRGSFGPASRRAGMALAAALVWTLHPLQTESVTYISQRAEAMMGLLFLLTVYGSARAFAAGRGRWWALAAVASAWAAALCKEVAAMALPVVLLYHHAFFPGRLTEKVRRHWRLYAGLLASWAILGGLLATSPRRVTVRFDLPGLTVPDYVRTQCNAVVTYLRLACWPDELVLDYGWPIVRRFADCAPSAGVLAVLALATLAALPRRAKVGFLGAWFFLILAPSSSVVPIASEVMAEHRMYLPLAAVATGAVVAAYAAGRWALRRLRLPRPAQIAIGSLLAAGVCAALGWRTFLRNGDYRTEIAIWTDNVRKTPDNPRAQYNLGTAYSQQGRYGDSLPFLERAVTLNPAYWEAQNNLALALVRLGRFEQALPHIRQAAELQPARPDVHLTLGTVQARLGRPAEAVASYSTALRLDGDYRDAHHSLATVLAEEGRIDESLAHMGRALGAPAASAEVNFRVGLLLDESGRPAQAAERYAAAVRADDSHVEAHFKLGYAYDRLARPVEAVREYEKAIELDPRHADAHNNLGVALAARGQDAWAADHFAAAVQANPRHPHAQANLAFSLYRLGRLTDALASCRKALEVNTTDPEAHNTMGLILAALGRTGQAAAEYREALRLAPDHAHARRNLEALLSGAAAASAPARSPPG